MKSRTSLFVIGIMVAMIAASLLTVLIMFLTGVIAKEKPELEFTVNEVEAKEYDGDPLKATGFRWASGRDNLKDGHRVEGTIFGSQTNYGTSQSDLRVKVYDEKDSDVTDEYSIKVNNCDLTILPKEITVVLQAQTVQYSGKEVAIDFYKVYSGNQPIFFPGVEETELIKGHKLIISFPGKFENVGDKLPDTDDWTSENFKIYDAAGVNVTNNYKMLGLLSGEGPIEIVPRRIQVKALDTEKYYDGTPIVGKYELVAGSLVEGDYIGDVKYVDNKKTEVPRFAEVGSKKVRISEVVVYRQEGFNLVPVSSENYNVENVDEYATLTVKKRPVTIKANDVEKVYDGTPLELSYTTDLTLIDFKIYVDDVDITESNVFEQEYVYENAKIVKLGVDEEHDKYCTKQFDIRYEKGTAKITPIKIQLKLNSIKQTYTGKEIENIPVVKKSEDDIFYAMGTGTLAAGIQKCIVDYGLSETDIGDSLEQINNEKVKTVWNQPIKNADTYSYGIELIDETAKELFGKAGNVIFDATAKFEVEKAYIGICYRDENENGVLINEASKIYDGLEAASALNFHKFVLYSGDLQLNALDSNTLNNDMWASNYRVSSADFIYVDNFTSHMLALDDVFYTVAVNNVHIINKATLEDVTQNFTTVAGGNENATIKPFNVSVAITPKEIYASVGQTVIEREVDGSINQLEANSIANEYKSSIRFEGLIAGDDIVYDAYELVGGYDEDTNCIKIFMYTYAFTNSNGEDVTDCYYFNNSNYESVLITVNLKLKGEQD